MIPSTGDGLFTKVSRARSVPVVIVDASGRTVATPAGTATQGPMVRRWFPVLFIDPLLVGIDSPADLSYQFWAVQVRVDDDRLLSGAIAATHRTLVFAAIAAISLLVGLVLTVRAARARTPLVSMRSEFVSSVTHELKTPVADIKVLGETLVRLKVAEPSSRRLASTSRSRSRPSCRACEATARR